MNKYTQVILLLSALFCSVLQAQIKVSSRLIDALTQQAVAYATVYISGTQNGIISSAEGYFSLNINRFPAELVVSHASYTTQTYVITSNTSLPSTLLLHKKELELPALTVQDVNQRQANLREFKTLFLGANYQDYGISIANEDAIYFERIRERRMVQVDAHWREKVLLYDSGQHYEWSADSSTLCFDDCIGFKVYARAPLLIHNPTLAYDVQVDLVQFFVDYTSHVTNSLAYYYFKPVGGVKDRKNKKVMKARRLAYFNSSQHFFRSLYLDQLSQNGYRVFEAVRSPEEGDSTTASSALKSDRCAGAYFAKAIDFSHFISTDDHKLYLNHLKDKTIAILYFEHARGCPKDMTDRRISSSYSQSMMRCLSGVCAVNNDGTMCDNSVLFSGSMGEKGLATMLPADFEVQ